MKDEPRPVQEIEPPTTAAAPQRDEDPTILARWLYRAYEQGPMFWLFLGGLAVVLLGVGTLVNSLMAGKSSVDQAWIDLIPAKTLEDQLKVADAHPKTPVADWAKLQAAYEEYIAGIDDLNAPSRRESAGPRLNRALDLFQQVTREAPHDSPQARTAAFAAARVLEARNELPEAIKQYRVVADGWKGSPEAIQAESLIRTLEDPNTVAFYKEYYAYKPPTGGAPSSASGLPTLPPGLDLPPGGSSDFIMPGAGKPIVPDLKPPTDIDPPPTPTPAPNPTPATPPAGQGTDVLPVPSAEPNKPAPPAGTPKSDMPSDPFTPTPKG